MEVRVGRLRGIVSSAYSIGVLVSLALFALLLLQVLYLAPWMLGTKAGSLRTWVDDVSNAWIAGTDPSSGFAMSPGTRVAIITASEDWQIDVVGDDVQGLTPIKSSLTGPGWGDLEVSIARHALLQAVARMTVATTVQPESITQQYVYLGKRYLGYGTGSERTVSGAGGAQITERAWFVGEVPVSSAYRITIALNLALLAFSLPFALSPFVISAQLPRHAYASETNS